jgi:hypothetical protein
MRTKSISYPAKKKSIPSPSFAKNSINLSGCASASTCGPRMIPSTSSNTTTGSITRGPTAVAAMAATAALTTISMNEASSTLIGAAAPRMRRIDIYCDATAQRAASGTQDPKN